MASAKIIEGKQNIVDEIVSKLDSSESVLVVEYQGTKGFINTFGGKATYQEIGTVRTIKSVTISSSITIPANTIIKNNVYRLDPWARSYYYIIYKGRAVLVDSSNFIYESHTYKFTALKNITVYKEIPNVYEPKKLTKVGTIKKGYDEEYQEEYIYLDVLTIEVMNEWGQDTVND